VEGNRKRLYHNVDGIDIEAELHLPAVAAGRAPALCICHGIPSGQPSDPGDGGYPLLAGRFCAAGFATFIFSFRGTGGSGGNFDIMGWSRDLEAAVDYLCSSSEVEGSSLSVMGFSGGAVVSAYVAANDPRIKRVILCACPAEFRMSAGQEDWESSLEHFRQIGMIRDKDFPPSFDDWVEGFRYIAPIRWIGRIAPRPLLLLHGADDDLVGQGHVRRLHDKAGEPRETAIIEGAGHKLRLSGLAMDTALRWLEKRPS